ncbi:hypothetical protein [Streptomyces turgidiscabies]|uniref:hypothetical protein n=1 Tax=Streptomyces turgidiscabies TaxID=85558 RepID=UPI0038F5DF9C
MNAKVWAITKSNSTLGHAFPEAKGLCNANIKPGGTLVTREVLEATGGVRICERCAFRMAHLAAKAEREANAPRPVEAQDVATIGDALGRVIYQGNASTHKRPQGFPQVITIEPAGKGLWALTDEDGQVFKRVKGNTRLWLQPCPANIDEIRAEASAQAEAIADSVTLVEVSAPVAQAERVSEPAHVADEDQDVTEAQAEDVPQAAQLDPEAQAEREAFERAKARAERLRNRKAHEVTVPVVKACANFRDLAWHANTEAARRYWQRRCLEISMVETVKAHARANYDLGWDTVVECYGDAEILEYLRSEYVNATTPEEAVKAFGSLADEWASQQCGALVDGYGV